MRLDQRLSALERRSLATLDDLIIIRQIYGEPPEVGTVGAETFSRGDAESEVDFMSRLVAVARQTKIRRVIVGGRHACA